MNMPSPATDLITKFLRRAILPSAAHRLRPRLALQLEQLLLKLLLLLGLLRRRPPLELGVKRLGRAPFRGEGVFFDLVP